MYDFSMPSPPMAQGHGLDDDAVQGIVHSFGRIKHKDVLKRVIDQDWDDLSSEDKSIVLKYFPAEMRALLSMSKVRNTMDLKGGKDMENKLAKRKKILAEAYESEMKGVLAHAKSLREAAGMGKTTAETLKARNEATAVEEKLPLEKFKLESESYELDARAEKQLEEATDLAELRGHKKDKMEAQTGELDARASKQYEEATDLAELRTHKKDKLAAEFDEILSRAGKQSEETRTIREMRPLEKENLRSEMHKTREETKDIREMRPHEQQKLDAESAELGARGEKHLEEAAELKETRPHDIAQTQANTRRTNAEAALKELEHTAKMHDLMVEMNEFATQLYQSGTTVVAHSIGFLTEALKQSLEPEGAEAGRPGLFSWEVDEAIQQAKANMKGNLHAITLAMPEDHRQDVMEVAETLFDTLVYYPGSMASVAGPFQNERPREHIDSFIHDLTIGQGTIAMQGDLTKMQAWRETATGNPVQGVTMDLQKSPQFADQYGEEYRRQQEAQRNEMQQAGSDVHRVTPGPRTGLMNQEEAEQMDSSGTSILRNLGAQRQQTPEVMPGTENAKVMSQSNPNNPRYNTGDKQRMLVAGRALLIELQNAKTPEDEQNKMRDLIRQNLIGGGMQADEVENLLRAQ